MARNILVIDDDPLVLKTIRKLLDKAGYVVETAKTAREGLEKGKNYDFDLIICDVRMPEINGIELITEVREFRKGKNKTEIPVIFITGYASEEAPIQAIKLGAEDYILKPFDIDKLLAAVNNILPKANECQAT